MAFARWERPIVDNTGKPIPGAVVTVRREVPGFPLAVPLYGDFAGSTTIDNPVTADAQGVAAFHVVGGFYRLDIVAPGFSRTLRHVGIGTAAGTDIDAYAIAGFTWAPESDTAAPPSAEGCIRFDDADLSAATHVFVHKTTLSGTDAEAWLAGLAAGGKSVKNRLMLAISDSREISWQVDAVSDGGDYIDLTVSDYSGPESPQTVTDAGFITLAREISGPDGPKSYNDLTDKPTLGDAAGKNVGTSAGQVPVLDGDGLLDTSVLPAVAIIDVFAVANQAAMLALTAQQGDVAIRSDLNKSFVLATNSPSTLADWKELLTPTDAVLAVAGLTGSISASALKAALSISNIREVLSASRTYYVRLDGSDSNDGLSDTAGGAFLTPQKAVDTVAALDRSIYNVTIQLGAGNFATWSSGGLGPGSGYVRMLGLGAASTSISTSVSGRDAVVIDNSNSFQIGDLKLSATGTNGCGIRLRNAILGTRSGLEFGACTYRTVLVMAGSRFVCQAPLTISGGSTAFISIEQGGGTFEVAGTTVTLTGTPNFSEAFAVVSSLGQGVFNALTFSGSATGSRYKASAGGVLALGGLTLPGNSAGTGTNFGASPYGLVA